MKKRGKSQAALEFLILAGVMMTVFVFFFAIATGKIAEMNEARRDKIANDIMDAVITELELAQQSLDGYTREFTLPENIEGREYEMALSHLGEENILSVMYMDRIYNREVNVEIEGELNRIYKGVNKVNKINGKITVFNGNDPCNDIIEREEVGDNSYCMGGMCYCFHGYYAPEDICTKENDFDLTTNECKYGCVADDACNPPPAITPFVIQGNVEKAKVTVTKGQPPDTTAKIIFDTNESATAEVRYLQPIEGVCPEEFPEKSYKQAFSNSLTKKFEILLTDMHADSEYCFEIEIRDSKNSKKVYRTSNLEPHSLTTDPDESPPFVRDVYLYPVISSTLPASYGDVIELIANITDDSDVDDAATKIIIKQKQDDGSYIELEPALGIKDTESGCGQSGRTVDGVSIEEVSGDSGYITCFSIDNLFAKYASYREDADTLFYASYDSSANPDFAKGSAAASGSPVIVDDGRYGKAMYVQSSSNGASYQTNNNLDISEGTIEFWVKPEWTDVFVHPILVLKDSTGTKKLYIFKGGNYLTASLTRTGSSPNIWGVQALNEQGQWSFIALTWKNLDSAVDDTEISLYLDGEPVPMTSGEDLGPVNFGQPSSLFYVGYNPDELGVHGNIKFDQFRILGRAKSGEEIRADYGTEKVYHIFIDTADRSDPPYSKTYLPGEYEISSFSVDYGP